MENYPHVFPDGNLFLAVIVDPVRAGRLEIVVDEPEAARTAHLARVEKRGGRGAQEDRLDTVRGVAGEDREIEVGDGKLVPRNRTRATNGSPPW